MIQISRCCPTRKTITTRTNYRIGYCHLIVRTVLCLSVLAVLFSHLVYGCDVPVFRYALEYWYPAEYELLVLHRRPLPSTELEIINQMRTVSSETVPYSNFFVRTIDMNERTDAVLEKVWEQMGKPELPCMILWYPRETGIDKPVWSGKITKENAQAIIDSPARREVAKRILEGESAVWILLETGDVEKDTAAKQLLEKMLKEIEEKLKPYLEESGLLEDLSEEYLMMSQPLKVAFSILHVSREDAAETMLVRMLEQSEPDLREYVSQPMTFPVFGRGRALFALVGKGIHEENITDACAFLVGPCSCQAKDLNPGTDLLMPVDWDAEIVGSVKEALNSQLLVGLETLVRAAETEEKPATATLANLQSGQQEKADASPPILRNMLIVFVLIVTGTIGIVLFITTHTSRQRS